MDKESHRLIERVEYALSPEVGYSRSALQQNLGVSSNAFGQWLFKGNIPHKHRAALREWLDTRIGPDIDLSDLPASVEEAIELIADHLEMTAKQLRSPLLSISEKQLQVTKLLRRFERILRVYDNLPVKKKS